MSTDNLRRNRLPRFRDRLPLGDKGLQVSPFCLGMVESEEAVCAAFDAGINFFFFSADMHWPLYEAARRGLARLLARGADLRKQIVVAVVSYVTQPEFCTLPFEEAVDAVPGLGSADVLVIGGTYSNDFLIRLPIYLEHRAQRFLNAAAVGATFHDRRAALLALNHGLVDIAYLRYNPSHPGARSDVFPHLGANRTTLLYTFKSASAFLPPPADQAAPAAEPAFRPSYTDYYRFSLTGAGVDGVLCAPGTPEEVLALSASLESGPLSAEQELLLLELAR